MAARSKFPDPFWFLEHHLGDNAVIRQFLTEDPALLQMTDGHFRSFLTAAVEKGDSEVVSMALQMGADPDGAVNELETPLIAATYSGAVSSSVIIPILLAAGASIEKQNLLSGTALHVAAKQGNCAAVELLLDFGADINCRVNSDDGWTPLMQAVAAGEEDVVSLLLRRGADLTVQDAWTGETVREIAARCQGERARRIVYLLGR